MHLPDRLRNKLKKPLGILVKNSDVTKESILKNIPTGSFVISVGDATTEKLIKYGIIPSLQIIDGMEKRIKRNLPSGDVKTSLNCSNPPAEITIESVKTIKKAFQSTKPVRITVNGEEDLLVLPVVVYAPDHSVALYGQPNEGLVIVPITAEIRNKAQFMMDSMN
ncbi:MAG TPA: GTP-dependent dephospho-CoA kinase family protein [Nitrosopumilaceae archaeon]|nr:GTP-dependent dephospho-CoA kinase family protein [Nitrosopumilaceae archaeon]